MRKNFAAGTGVILGAMTVLMGSVEAQNANRRVLFPTEAQFSDSAEAQRLVRAARAFVGDDLEREYANMCTHTGPQRMVLAREQAGLPPIENYVVEPTRIFDNMWFVGPTYQGAFVITTSDGLILLDTLNNTEEARDILVPSIEKAGLDPRDIKYIVLSHGHPGQTDHTGGANYLQRTYGARVAMGPERPLAERDIDIVDGSTLTLGDTTLSFAISPGHSVGTLAMFIPVTWQGEAATVMLHGGAVQTPDRAALDALERIVNDIAKPDGIRGLLNTHPGIYQDTIGDMETIRGNPDGPNPLLYSGAQAQRYWSMIVECARARVVALEEANGGG
jgi:metallo-beta-lactamase class B